MAIDYLDIYQYPSPGRDLKRDDMTANQIASHLEGLLQECLSSPHVSIKLPPLVILGKYYNVSLMVLHDAFRILRKQGYDYLLPGMELPINFWISRPAPQGKSSKRNKMGKERG